MDWQEIPGFDGYRVSDTGIVQSCWLRSGSVSWKGSEWITLKPAPSPKGYWRVNLRVAAGRKRRVHVHVLVLLAFVGPRPPGLKARHLDDDKSNNCRNNLAWGTSKENSDDALRNGRRTMGEQHYAARLSDTDVAGIRVSDESDAVESARHGVSEDHIYKIRCGDRRSGGSKVIKRRGKFYKLTDEQIAYVRTSSKTTVALAKELGISQPYASHIKLGRVRA